MRSCCPPIDGPGVPEMHPLIVYRDSVLSPSLHPWRMACGDIGLEIAVEEWSRGVSSSILAPLYPVSNLPGCASVHHRCRAERTCQVVRPA